MEVSLDKTKGMHVHKREKVSETSENEVAAMNFKHKCPDCSRPFPTLRGQKIHSARWCNVTVNGTEIENVDSFVAFVQATVVHCQNATPEIRAPRDTKTPAFR